MVALSQYSFNGPEAAAQWRSMIADRFGAGDNWIGPDHRFCGSIRHGILGQIEISHVASSREVSRRTQHHVRTDSRDTYMLVKGVTGDVNVQQGSTRTQVLPHSFVFYCASRPYEWQHMCLSEVRNIAIPGHLLRARLRNVDQYTCRSFPDTVGMWRILADMMEASLKELVAIPDAASYQLGAQIVDLLALALEGDGRLSLHEKSSRAAIFHRSLRFIRGDLADARLGAELIASAIGISPRSLHRVFAENGTTVSECVREERLNASLALLSNAALAAVPISEIAYRAGFHSHAHFSHAFRCKFGMTPTAWRKDRS